MEQEDLAELVDEIRRLRETIEGMKDMYTGAVRVKVVSDQ